MMIKFEILSETELLRSIRVGNPGLQLRRNKWRRTGLFLLNGLDRGKKRVYEVSECHRDGCCLQRTNECSK